MVQSTYASQLPSRGGSQPSVPLLSSLPTDPTATPKETLVAVAGSWRFTAMDNLPLITRKAGGLADKMRVDFLAAKAPIRSGAVLPLMEFAREMGRLWGARLPPDFPAAFRPSTVTASTEADLSLAIVVLLRVGLLVVDGFNVDAVTRTPGHVSDRGHRFVRNEEALAPRIYTPGDKNSGVTVGPGYDIGSKSRQSVVDTLTSVGVSAPAAAEVAGGVGLKGADASAFVAAHKNGLCCMGQ